MWPPGTGDGGCCCHEESQATDCTGPAGLEGVRKCACVLLYVVLECILLSLVDVLWSVYSYMYSAFMLVLLW